VPTYEYQCNGCGRVFEVRQRISEAPLTRCETCGGTVKRLLSAAPFILKGEGWYVTDYPSASRKKALESEKSGGDGASKSETKKDSAAKESAAPVADKPAASSSTTAPTTAVGPTQAKTSSSD
jgi:putative FmdB family regulatory protein